MVGVFAREMCVARGEARAGRRAARAPGRTRRARLQAQTVRRRLDAAALGAKATVDVDRVDALDRPRRHGLGELLPARSARTGPRSRLPAMCWIPGGFGPRDPPSPDFSGRGRAAVHGNRPRNCWRRARGWSRREQTREGDAVRRLVHASESLARLATRRRIQHWLVSVASYLRDPGAWPRPRVFYPELHAARLVERARLEENFPTEGRDDPRAGAFLALRRVRPGGLQRARHRVVGAAPRGQAAARAAQITESDRVRGCLGWSCRQQNPKVPRQPGSHRAVNAA